MRAGRRRLDSAPSRRPRRAPHTFSALVAALLAAGAAAPACAQEIHGTLLAAETGTPLPFGVVELLDGNLRSVATAYTDELGRFALLAPEPGRYALRGQHMTAQPLISAQLDLAEGQVAVLEFALALQPIELDPLLVSVRPEYRQLVRNGFYDRARSSLGTFVTPEQIERANPFRPTDLLRRFPGIRIEPDPERIGHYLVTMSRTVDYRGSLAGGAASRCRPQVMLDGVYMFEFDIDTLPVQDIFAVEVYRSPVEAPAQYAGPGSSCGIILVWTGKRIGPG